MRLASGGPAAAGLRKSIFGRGAPRSRLLVCPPADREKNAWRRQTAIVSVALAKADNTFQPKRHLGRQDGQDYRLVLAICPKCSRNSARFPSASFVRWIIRWQFAQTRRRSSRVVFRGSSCVESGDR